MTRKLGAVSGNYKYVHGLSKVLRACRVTFQRKRSIEIGCLGYFMPETISQVAKVCQVAKKTVQTLFEQGAHTAVSCFLMLELFWCGIYQIS